MTENLFVLEREVEAARAKLARDLARLRSPQPYRQFSAELKFEAKSFAQRFLDDLKARAAANPSAALAIGAGIGWRLLKDPPIATALIGAGIVGLWRASPRRVSNEDYLTTAQRRFGEQLSEAAETATEYASEATTSASNKVGAYAQSAFRTVEEFSTSAAEQAAEAFEGTREAAADISGRAANVVQRATSRISKDGGVRDQVLLGVAGAAVIAALSIAYRHRPIGELRPGE